MEPKQSRQREDDREHGELPAARPFAAAPASQREEARCEKAQGPEEKHPGSRRRFGPVGKPGQRRGEQERGEQQTRHCQNPLPARPLAGRRVRR